MASKSNLSSLAAQQRRPSLDKTRQDDNFSQTESQQHQAPTGIVVGCGISSPCSTRMRDLALQQTTHQLRFFFAVRLFCPDFSKWHLAKPSRIARGTRGFEVDARQRRGLSKPLPVRLLVETNLEIMKQENKSLLFSSRVRPVPSVCWSAERNGRRLDG